MQALWNTYTSLPIPRCRELTDKRKRHCVARLHERPLSEWQSVIEAIQGSAFCRGENDRGWKATFDWLVESPETAVKVLEGKYADRAQRVIVGVGKTAGNAGVAERFIARTQVS